MTRARYPSPVSMVDSSETGAISRALAANQRKRERATAQLDEARHELRELLLAGRKAGLSVSEMSRQAGVSRETAHQLLREGSD